MASRKGKRALASAASAQIAFIDDYDISDKGTSKVLSSRPGVTTTELLFDPTVSLGVDETGG